MYFNGSEATRCLTLTRVMPHITKTATASLFYPSLLCSASTSRLTPFRNYATESEFPPTTTPNAPTFGTTVEQKIEKAETKRYTGPGFPAIPVIHPPPSPRTQVTDRRTVPSTCRPSPPPTSMARWSNERAHHPSSSAWRSEQYWDHHHSTYRRWS